MEICPKCKGKGKLRGKRHMHKCPRCHGLGTVKAKNQSMPGLKEQITTNSIPQVNYSYTPAIGTAVVANYSSVFGNGTGVWR
jgi:RecJ-like exonuclease